MIARRLLDGADARSRSSELARAQLSRFGRSVPDEHFARAVPDDNPTVQPNIDVDPLVGKSEVHALIGENGAG